MKILVIDDHPLIQEALVHVLAELDAELDLLQAYDASDAHAALSRSTPLRGNRQSPRERDPARPQCSQPHAGRHRARASWREARRAGRPCALATRRRALADRAALAAARARSRRSDCDAIHAVA